MISNLLKILLVDDEPIVHKTIGDYLLQSGHAVTHAGSGREALHIIQSDDLDLVLADVKMAGITGLELLEHVRIMRPDLPFVIITAHGNLEMAVEALRKGATDFLTKPVKLLELDAALLKASRVWGLYQQRRHLKDTIRGMQSAYDLRERGGALVGSSPALNAVRIGIRQVVESRLDTILITGETGTGKEVVAREIHNLSGPAEEKPFIAVSCPALPDSLVESELFGHVKGAFTGAASDRAGYFELADGGTLFLDEIADLSPLTQATLLRVLETRTLRRVGGVKESRVDIRVIAATNVPLEEGVEKGKFRRDLYYRINVFNIYLAPLRERREDILPLADHFLCSFVSAKRLAISGLTAAAQELLQNYHFPGNARELRNIIERAAVLCQKGEIGPEHLHIQAARVERAESALTIDREREMLLQALESCKWNRRAAAQKLGIPYSTLRFKMQKWGIS